MLLVLLAGNEALLRRARRLGNNWSKVRIMVGVIGSSHQLLEIAIDDWIGRIHCDPTQQQRCSIHCVGLFGFVCGVDSFAEIARVELSQISKASLSNRVYNISSRSMPHG